MYRKKKNNIRIIRAHKNQIIQKKFRLFIKKKRSNGENVYFDFWLKTSDERCKKEHKYCSFIEKYETKWEKIGPKKKKNK